MTNGATGVPPAPAGSPPASLSAARAWRGAKLHDFRGRAVGKVEGVLVDAGGGEPVWLTARLGRFGRCAVPFEFTAEAADRVWVPFDQETIRAAAEIDPSGGLSCGEEENLCALYGTSVRQPCLGASPDDVASVPAG